MSTRSPAVSSSEKHDVERASDTAVETAVETAVYDPDAGCTEEERAAIVRLPTLPNPVDTGGILGVIEHSPRLTSQ
jgi:hypothetical protein